MRKIKTNLFTWGGILAVFSMMILACPMLPEEPEPTPDEIAKEQANAVLAAVGTEGSSVSIITGDSIQFEIVGGDERDFSGSASIRVLNVTYGGIEHGSDSASVNVDYQGSNSNASIPVALLVPNYLTNNVITITITIAGVYKTSTDTATWVYSDINKDITIPTNIIHDNKINGTLSALSYVAGSLVSNKTLAGTLAGVSEDAGSLGTLSSSTAQFISLLANGSMPAVLIGTYSNINNINSFSAVDVPAGSVGTDAAFVNEGSFSLGSMSLEGTLAINDSGTDATTTSGGSITVYFGTNAAATPAKNSVILKAGNLLYAVPQFGVLVTLGSSSS